MLIEDFSLIKKQGVSYKKISIYSHLHILFRKIYKINMIHIAILFLNYHVFHSHKKNIRTSLMKVRMFYTL